MDELRQIFSIRSEYGAPPELHMHFSQIPKDFPKSFPSKEFTEE